MNRQILAELLRRIKSRLVFVIPFRDNKSWQLVEVCVGDRVLTGAAAQRALDAQQEVDGLEEAEQPHGHLWAGKPGTDEQ